MKNIFPVVKKILITLASYHLSGSCSFVEFVLQVVCATNQRILPGEHVDSFGTILPNSITEFDFLNPSSPYAAFEILQYKENNTTRN
jgi:hypothetical protein